MVPFLRFNLAETNSAHPCKEEAKDSKSPTQWKLPQWKLNANKTQCRESDKKPSVPETRTTKNKLSRKLTQLSLIPEDRQLRTESSLLWLEGCMPNKILIPLQSLISCFLELPPPTPPPCTSGLPAVGATEGLWQRLLLSVSQRLYYLLGPSTCCPSRWGFFCP